MPKRLFLVFVLLNCANVMFAQFSIDWEAEKRFGVDLNRNGKIDIPNSYEYVHPEAFYLDIFLTGNGSDLNELLQRPQRFRWTVRDAAGNVLIEEETRAPRLKAALPEQGDYSVTAAFDGQTAAGTVTVRDYFIACLGDSSTKGFRTLLPESGWEDLAPEVLGGVLEEADAFRLSGFAGAAVFLPVSFRGAEEVFFCSTGFGAGFSDFVSDCFFSGGLVSVGIGSGSGSSAADSSGRGVSETSS